MSSPTSSSAVVLDSNGNGDKEECASGVVDVDNSMKTKKKKTKLVKASSSRRELSPLRDKMALFEGDGGAKQIDEAARKKSSERARSVSPVPQRLKGDALSPFAAAAGNKQKTLLLSNNGGRTLSPIRGNKLNTDALNPFDDNIKDDDNVILPEEGQGNNGPSIMSLTAPQSSSSETEKEKKEDDEEDDVVVVSSLEDEEQQQVILQENKQEEEQESEEETFMTTSSEKQNQMDNDLMKSNNATVEESQPVVVLEVKRIPKRSAILARDSPERELYIQQRIQQKLETWNNNKDTKWRIVQHTFDGYSVSETKEEKHITITTVSSLEDAIDTFTKDPETYIAMYYNREIVNSGGGGGGGAGDGSCSCSFTVTFVLRSGTTGYKAQDLRTDTTGRFVLYQHVYQRLPPMKDDSLPVEYRDQYTDTMTYLGKLLHNNVDKTNDDGRTIVNNKPIMPGRGMGIADTANMKLFGEEGATPNDIFQGDAIGDCWLLSAIACLADFDFAVKRLFRKTTTKNENLSDLPHDEPNQYTITLWDLKTWNEVDIVVDERLPVRGDGSGFLLGAKPSREGFLWVPYLEKAIAIHCGGYDKLEGKESWFPSSSKFGSKSFADSRFRHIFYL